MRRRFVACPCLPVCLRCIVSRAHLAGTCVQSGLVAMAAGAVGALLRRAAQTLLEAAQRHFVVRAQIDSRDDAYWWVMHWLAHRPGAASSRHVSVASSLTDLAGECTGHERGEDAEAGWEDEDAVRRFSFLDA